MHQANPARPVTAAIAMGSNLGDRAANISGAVAALRGAESIEVRAEAAPIETEPVGPAGQGPYLNAAVLVATTLPPRELLALLMDIERRHGRERSALERWGPRTLDLDLLLYGDLILDEPGLTIPHLRMHERTFVLEPLAAIAPHLRHPVLGSTVAELLDALRAKRTAWPE